MDGIQESANRTVVFTQVNDGIKRRRLRGVPLAAMMLAPSLCRYLAGICDSIATECGSI